MRCASCGFENPTLAKFCEECGGMLARACPACGHEVSASAKFCSECGAPLSGLPPSAALAASAPIEYTPPYLAERIRAAQAPMEARGAAAGERKTATPQFADVAG